MSCSGDLRELAKGIFNCSKNCNGVCRRDPQKGIVPRYFAVYPAICPQKRIDGIICGENPGRTSAYEGLWWREIINKGEDPLVAYGEYVKTGIGFPDKYFYLPYGAVKEEVDLPSPIVYFTNLAKCEYEDDEVVSNAIQGCRCFLTKEIAIMKQYGLVSENTPVFLLGADAFDGGDAFFREAGFKKVGRRPHPSRTFSSRSIERYKEIWRGWAGK